MKTTNCSKNYVNCRKHPARAGTISDKMHADLTFTRKNSREEYKTAKQAVDALPEDASTYVKNKARRELKIADINKLATSSKQQLDALRREPKWSDGSKMSAGDFTNVFNTHERLMRELQTNAEKETYYSEDRKMDAFQEAVTKVMIDEGNFYYPADGSSSWGDTRGTSDYHAEEHFKECGVKGVNSYDESASWSVYDSFHSDETVGVKAELSCNCGEKFKTRVYMEQMDPGKLISKIMNRSS